MRLECDPDIPVAPGEEHYVLDPSLDEGLVGFLELERKYEFSHEVRRGAQGASRVAPGKSGVYACDEEEPINALESW